MQRYLDTPTDAHAQADLQVWLDHYQTYGQYDRVFLLDTRGVGRLSAPAAPEPVAAHLAESAAAILSTGQVTFADFHRDTDGGPIHLALLVPIFASQDRARPLGLLVLRIDPHAYLYPYIQQWPVPSASAETQLIRREGTDALFLNELRFQAGTALNLRFPLENTQLPAVKAALGQEGIVEGVDYRGAPVLAALHGVPDSPWLVVAKMDIAEVRAPLRERLWQTVTFFGALMAAFGAVLGLAWRQQRLRYYRGQVEAAQALRESNERFSLAVRAARLGVWDWDIQKNELIWDDRMYELYGVKREDFAGAYEAWLAGLHPDDRAASDELSQQARRGEKEYDTEFRIRWPDATVRVLKANGQVMWDTNGNPLRMTGINYDITARKQAEQRAFELALERERVGILTKFIQDASHEFRTPLSIMQTNVYLLERLEDPAKRQRKLAQIGDQVTSLTRLVELLVEMTRLDSGVPFTLQPTDLNQWIAAEAGKLQAQVAAKGLTLHLALAPDLPPVAADGNRLGRALHELLDNAVRFTPAGGRVTVRTAGDAAGVTVEVQDTGPGIPPDVLPRIFERFYRQDVAHTTPGFGLGLPIVRTIVERHGGRLEVESQPGAGSVFRIRLPLEGAPQAG